MFFLRIYRDWRHEHTDYLIEKSLIIHSLIRQQVEQSQKYDIMLAKARYYKKSK